MKNKEVRHMLQDPALRMNLQYFAKEGDSGDGGDAGDSGAGEENSASGEGAGDSTAGAKEPDFDELLKGGHQAEFDRRVQQAVDAAISQQKTKYEALMDDKLSEAEKLARMTKEEKATYLQQKREKELSDREAAVTRKELMAEAKGTLAEKKLPVGLAEVLDYTDAESCKKSMGTVEKAFQEAVEAAVEERLKGGKPPKKAPESGDDLAKQVENLMMGEF